MHIPMYNNAPRSAGLPVTRNMPYSSSSVPHRSRNLTGIYLGLEGNTKPPRSKSAIPPLARGRGMSANVRTPTEDRRYKMVEYLRIKEEKRGFTGGTVRNVKSAHSTSTQHQQDGNEGHTDGRRRWGPGKRIDPSNIDDLIKPNPRNYTAVSNSGVTRSEKLVGWNPIPPDQYSLTPMDNVVSEVAEEVQKIAANEELTGLEECYKRICKAEEEPVIWGNIETLYSLLPNRKGTQSRRDNVGFTVRSYRNPAKAEILAEFPDPFNPHRPKTVPIQRPLVPSPFFFRHHYAPFSGNANNPLSLSAHASRRPPYAHHGHSSATVKLDDSDQLIVPRILAVPGAGGITKTLQYGQSPLLTSLQLLNGKEYMSHLPLSVRSAEEIEDVSRQNQPVGYPPTSPNDFRGQSPKEEAQQSESEEVREEEPKIADSSKEEENAAQEEPKEEESVDKEEEPSKDGENMTSQVMIVGGDMTTSSRPRPRLTTSNSGADIMLGLETDDGKSAEVEIDSLESDELRPEDEIPKGRVRKTSIVEKISKSKESELIALSIKENAGQRQREFEKLISEHQELVQEISRTPSAENIVQSESGRDP